MKNGQGKLIAKIQHFYDSVISAKERNEDAAMSTDNGKEKEHKRCVAECYASVGTMYNEIFKEFLYHSDERSDD
jgi:hypothetical protein